MKKSCEACKSGDTNSFDIEMAFQPIIDLHKFEIMGYEALVRGINGEGAPQILKQVSSDELYAFDQRCRTKAIETASELKLCQFLSINFMPNAVYEPARCIQTTLEAAKKHNFPLDLLVFEFTEHEEIIDIQHISDIVSDYQQRGFLTAIDDFGSGYSGLNLLSQVKVDIVKIDRKLIIGIDQDPRRIRMMRGVHSMLSPIVSKIVVEGIETINELKCMYSLGFRYFQGLYFAKPEFKALPTVDLGVVKEQLGEKRS